MKGTSGWSYAPYRPCLTVTGDIYICRIVPGADSIHLEWLEKGGEYAVYYRVRGEEAFAFSGTTTGNEWVIEDLQPGVDYEFYVCSGNKKGRIRLARTGECVDGIIVNYLHPDDEVYAFSGRYLCSPSLLRHPDGYMLASMDLFDYGAPQNLTLIFRSDDGGKTWRYVSELMPSFWGKMFLHNGDIYMLSCSTEYGDLLIGKSTDGGRTFGTPSVLLRGANGKKGSCGVHKNPQNVLVHNGRIYETLEWGAWANKEYGHAAMVMSCDVNDDLLVPENWSFTEPVPFDTFAPELEGLSKPVMTIEGTLTVAPDGRLLNIMRFGMRGFALVYEVDTVHHEAPLKYAGLMPFPANFSKFMIKYDPVSEKYYSVATRLYEGCRDSARNLLSLLCSADLKEWIVVCDLLDYRHLDVDKVGFQYVDFDFEGDDLVYLCRTAFNEAHNFHDANYSTFHRIRLFRTLGK